MAERVDALLAYWAEQRTQLRQSETQRSVLTNYVLVLVTAITGLIVQQRFALRTLPLAVLLTGLGGYGALASAKYHERAEYHLSQARALTRTLVDVGALPPDTLLDEHREHHYGSYPRMSRVRLHLLWTGLHLAVSAGGLILTAVIIGAAL